MERMFMLSSPLRSAIWVSGVVSIDIRRMISMSLSRGCGLGQAAHQVLRLAAVGADEDPLARSDAGDGLLEGALLLDIVVGPSSRWWPWRSPGGFRRCDASVRGKGQEVRAQATAPEAL